MSAQPERAFAPRRSLAAATGALAFSSSAEEPPDGADRRASPAAGAAPVREGSAVPVQVPALLSGAPPREAGAPGPRAWGADPPPAVPGAGADPASSPATLDALRALVRSPARAASPAGRLLLGAPLDAALGGGLPRGALHEVHGGAPGAHGVLLGFAAALAGALVGGLAGGLGGPVLWVRQDMSVREGGRLHAPGCAELGLDPDRIVLVEAADAAGVLRAAEDGLRQAGAGVVIAEPWGAARVLDLTATRRLALRAAERGALALLLRPGAEPEPSAAATRWHVAPAGSASPLPFGLGAPAFALELARNRFGPTGRWIVEFDADARRFGPLAPGAAPSGRGAAAARHRPAGDHGAPARRAAS